MIRKKHLSIFWWESLSRGCFPGVLFFVLQDLLGCGDLVDVGGGSFFGRGSKVDCEFDHAAVLVLLVPVDCEPCESEILWKEIVAVSSCGVAVVFKLRKRSGENWGNRYPSIYQFIFSQSICCSNLVNLSGFNKPRTTDYTNNTNNTNNIITR